VIRRRTIRKIGILLGIGLLPAWALAQAEQPKMDKLRYTLQVPYPVETIKAPKKKARIKNVVLMIGDGMSLHQVGAAWAANRGRLYFEQFPYIGLAKTYCSNKLITDSGAGATAMGTGHKTAYHAVGVDPQGNDLVTLTDLSNKNGLGTGIVVACGLTDATPASFAANNIDREEEEELASDFLNSNVDILFGGGRKYFNQRKDQRDLLKEMEQKGYSIVTSAQDFLNTNQPKIMAPVVDGQLDIAPKRGTIFQDAAIHALDLLKQHHKGFFAMIEGSRIDDMGHVNNLPGVVEEVLDFDQTIGKVLKWAEKDGNTLVIVVADHETGGLTLLDGDKNTGTIAGHFSTGGHSGVMVPVYAWGPGAEQFTGIYENTDLFHKIVAALRLK
jgi:alkaline phosphatase